MFKKISAALIIMAIMLISVLPMGVSAESLLFEENVNVKANIMVENAAGGIYDNAPANRPLIANQGAAFDYIAKVDMSSVREKFTELFSKENMNTYWSVVHPAGLDDATYEQVQKDLTVKMKMTVSINVPSGLTVGSDFLAGSNLDGFAGNDDNGMASDLKIYKEVSRKQDGREYIIEVEVVNPDDDTQNFVTGKQLKDNLEKYLGDLELEYLGVKSAGTGRFKVKGTIIGATDIYYKGRQIGTINYKGVQDPETGDDDLSATVQINASQTTGTTTGGRTGGTSGGTVVSAPQVTANIGGTSINTGYAQMVNGQYVVNVEELPLPETIPGYVVPKTENGATRWFSDPACTQEVTGVIPIDGDTTLYARYINVDVPSVFEADDHLAYIKGYPEGTVKPLQNISREEVAEILYRLLNADAKSRIVTTENNFSDVAADRWSNKSISTMANGGYVQGYEDGTFLPGRSITRAQLATMLVRFLDSDSVAAGNFTFTDISGHWAENYIKTAANHMWIQGYEDGSFKPDQYITRAEAITMFNRILVRYVNAEGLHASAKQWPDNGSSAWYYYQMLEATNSHDFVRQADGYNENWTSILSETLFD